MITPAFEQRFLASILAAGGPALNDAPYLGQHLAFVSDRFANSWDSLQPAGSLTRYVSGSLVTTDGTYTVSGRLAEAEGTVTLQDVQISLGS